MRLVDVAHADVQAWVSSLSASGLSAGSVHKVHRVLSMVLGLAVRDGRLPRNPAAQVDLPRAAKAEKRYLRVEQVANLADAAGPGRLVVLVLAYCGLRWGELAALRVSRLDLMRRRIHVAESLTEVNGGRRGARRSWFDRAVETSGMPTGLHPHELRHTAASLAVSAGANVKAVQRILGHAKASMTLDVYADLFDDDLEALADRLDEIARTADRGPSADYPRTVKVIMMPNERTTRP